MPEAIAPGLPASLMLVAAVVCCVVGLGWFALAIESHWRDVRGPEAASPATVTGLRVAGAVALAASLLLCLVVDHPSMASLVWVMVLAAGALIVAFTLAWRPHWLAPLTLGLGRRPRA